MKPQHVPRSALRTTGFLALIAGLLALFFATKDSIHQQTLGLPITWGKNLWWKAMEWYAWAVFSPAIFRLCQRFDFSAHPGRTILAQLGCGSVAALLHCCVLTTGARIEAQVLQTGLSWLALFPFVFANHFHENVLTYVGIVSTWYALDYHNRFKERERRAAELEASVAQARLQALKTQLHPHFLFNTLNGIAALIYENPKAAHRMLATLSELLRLSLKDQREDEVSLSSELDFAQRYLELEGIRFGPRLTVELNVAPETLDARVPGLILQPLLENAIKHAIAPFSKPGRIAVFAGREQDVLLLRVTDNGPGLQETKNISTLPGIGLRNSRARLQTLYGDRHRLDFKTLEGGGLQVEIAIPFRVPESPPARIDYAYEDSHAHC